LGYVGFHTGRGTVVQAGASALVVPFFLLFTIMEHIVGMKLAVLIVIEVAGLILVPLFLSLMLPLHKEFVSRSFMGRPTIFSGILTRLLPTIFLNSFQARIGRNSAMAMFASKGQFLHSEIQFGTFHWAIQKFIKNFRC
jgi:hypothetical protein